ncbi:MAG: thermonuclease family protein [Weeksellaceae bacterium]
MKKKIPYLAFIVIVLSFIYFNTSLFDFSTKSETVHVEETKRVAKVIRIIDGDTLEVLYNEKPIKIRLAHIDCPENNKGQAFGKAAKKALSDLCFGQEIQLEWGEKIDKYGRYIAVLYTKEGENINKEMVRKGMAWHYKKYSADSSYSELEKEARDNKIGLWQDSDPIPPWNWRKKKEKLPDKSIQRPKNKPELSTNN